MNLKFSGRVRCAFGALVCAATLIGATGCSTYQQQGQAMTDQWHQGNIPGAAQNYTAEAEKKKDTKDAVIWRLEQAAALRAAGQFAESNKAFEEADQKISAFEEKAKVHLGQEAGSIFSNQANLDYEGRTYDKIMLNTYKALNYLALDDVDRARVELIRTYQRQQDAVEINKKQIEKLQEVAAQNKDKDKVDKAEQDGKFKGEMDSSYGDLNRIKTYADFVNPFSVYLDGLVFMCSSTGGSDLERANKSFERALGFADGNKFVAQDAETLKQVMQGQSIPPCSYVIFETGGAPIREQIRIDIPIIISNVSYVGAAFPKIVFLNDYLPSLTVTAGGVTETTAPVASMDSVIGSEFKSELPGIITKTLISTITKAVAAYAVNEAAGKQDAVVGLFSKLVTAGAQAAVNIADLRTWTTLPKEFQICRVPTPADRKLILTDSQGGHRTEIALINGTVNLVYVRSVTQNAGLLITQSKLK